jgi:putative transposase
MSAAAPGQRSGEMARPPRIDIAGMPQHLVVRGNNRCDLFVDDHDRMLFLKYLQEAIAVTACEIHAYVLMTNHVHLLASPTQSGGLSRMVQAVGRRFSRYANRRQQRTGTLFEGRFRASLVQTERYFLACMRYIELNPVRAGLAKHPAELGWSSYPQNASGLPSGIISPHPEYLRLGPGAESRGAAYRALCEEALPQEVVAQIRASASTSALLGDIAFQRSIKGDGGNATSSW